MFYENYEYVFIQRKFCCIYSSIYFILNKIVEIPEKNIILIFKEWDWFMEKIFLKYL